MKKQKIFFLTGSGSKTALAALKPAPFRAVNGCLTGRSRKAFTLAEVLIALTIIGVIAAITVPALIQRTNKQEYVSALQKTYSTLSQAAQMIITENGNPKCDDGGWACSTEDVYKMFKKYLNNAKECGNTSSGCFDGTYLQYNGGTVNFTGRYNFVMADGTLVSMRKADFSNDCSGVGSGSTEYCQLIVVDVNGAKKPNVVGLDTFSFVLKPDGLHYAGCDSNGCKKTLAGWGCTCKVIREGAINYI